METSIGLLELAELPMLEDGYVVPDTNIHTECDEYRIVIDTDILNDNDVALLSSQIDSDCGDVECIADAEEVKGCWIDNFDRDGIIRGYINSQEFIETHDDQYTILSFHLEGNEKAKLYLSNYFSGNEGVEVNSEGVINVIGKTSDVLRLLLSAHFSKEDLGCDKITFSFVSNKLQDGHNESKYFIANKMYHNMTDVIEKKHAVSVNNDYNFCVDL